MAGIPWGALRSLISSVSPGAHTHPESDVTGLVAGLASKATPADITAAVNALVAGAPGALDTLLELANQMAADESVVTALTATVAGKAPTSRLITAGTGLTGGGDLSADRTLTVAYGTSGSTAAAGNDARLSDSRPPTAHHTSHESGGSDPVALAASQITSGVLAIGRLATGTPDGTKFVRDDGTLATPAGGGAVGTDTLFDAKGDLPVGTGADTAAKLAAGSTGQALVPDSSQTTGLKWAYRSRVLAEVHADAGSASSVAEQTLASLVLPGGLIAVGDTVRFTAFGDRKSTTGSAVGFIWKFKIGSTTVMTAASQSIGSNAPRMPWEVVCDIAFPTTTSQRVGGMLIGSGTSGALTSWALQSAANSAIGYGTAAEDTASNLNVILTCQMDVNNANADVILHAASLIHLPKG